MMSLKIMKGGFSLFKYSSKLKLYTHFSHHLGNEMNANNGSNTIFWGGNFAF